MVFKCSKVMILLFKFPYYSTQQIDPLICVNFSFIYPQSICTYMYNKKDNTCKNWEVFQILEISYIYDTP